MSVYGTALPSLYAAKSDTIAGIADMPPARRGSGTRAYDPVYGPAVRCKRFRRSWRCGLAWTVGVTRVRTRREDRSSIVVSSDFASSANAEANHVGTPDL